MKRSPSPFQIEEHHGAKKPKLECSTKSASPVLTAPVDRDSRPVHIVGEETVVDETPNNATADHQTSERQIPEVEFKKDATPQQSTLKAELPKEQTKTKKVAIKRKAGEGFRPWRPKPAYVEIPAVQPHWGIVPRPGGYRPSEPQPSARDSHAAVKPPLWEDRKGAVRLKRGNRFIGEYDQAYHMWLRLMDMRPISKKNQAPKRTPVAYYYEHGMPVDWNNTGAVNDLNKALQEAVKAKSNKETQYTPIERQILAGLFAQSPEASIWDIAEQFNHQAHPLNGTEDGQYPKGRFIESICHEYCIYKSTYDNGKAPTDATEKEVQLEKLWAAKKAASQKPKPAPKKDKVPKEPKMSDTAGVARKKRAPKKSDKKQNIEDMVAATGAAQVSVRPMSEQPRLSDDDESLLEMAGAYAMEDVLSPYARAVVASSGYGYGVTAVGQNERALVAQTPICADETDKPAAQTKLAMQKTQLELNVVAVDKVVSEPSATIAATTSTVAGKATRDIQIDENYDDDDDVEDLFEE